LYEKQGHNHSGKENRRVGYGGAFIGSGEGGDGRSEAEKTHTEFKGAEAVKESPAVKAPQKPADEGQQQDGGYQ
jgi:hypothetical protein